MSIFAPHISQIGDTGVPVACPCCKTASVRDGLTSAEKQYLLDATSHHSLLTEYRYLIAMKGIVDRYPGTQHPLLRNKLLNPGRGFTNEAKVAALLKAQPALSAFLKISDFKLVYRFQFVCERVSESREALLPILLGCETCPDQYLILPEDFYFSIG